jgi:hypothetical protein
MIRSKLIAYGLPALCGLASLGISKGASALPQEVQIILLDASGSMLDPAKPNPSNPTTKLSKWDQAFEEIQKKLTAQKKNLDVQYNGQTFSARNHCTAVWAFSGTAVKHVYPLPTGTTAPITVVDATTINNIGFFKCPTDSDHTTDDTIGTLYDTMNNDIRFTVQNNTSVKPASGAPSTPLAKSLCVALKTTRNIQNQAGGSRRVMLMSDGLENSTPSGDECGDATPAGTTKLDYAYQKKDAANQNYLWAGGTLSTQWEYKVFTTAVFNNTNGGPFKSPYNATELNKWSVNETWDAFLTRIAAPPVVNKVLVDVFSLYDYVAPQANIPTKLQDMFDDLAVKTKGATQRVKFGAGYPVPVFCPGGIPGDVDCNNHVNDADYQMMTQSDVWRLPVVTAYDRSANPPILRYHDLRNKCDFNRDGIVNGYDEDILLNNYGI